MHDKVTYLEERSRRKSLRFDVLSQTRNEDWYSSKVKIKDLIKEKLGLIENFEIELAYRAGKTKKMIIHEK